MANEQPAPKKVRIKPRERLFDIDDALLMQRSRTLRQHFINNLAAFTALDADLNNTFADNWLLAIEECENCPTDETMNDELRDRTLTLEKGRSDCLEAANDLKYYVEKAFPGTDEQPDLTKSMLREFGFTERAQVRQKSMELIAWLLVMGKMAQDEYPAELAAVNMPAAVLTTISQTAEALLEAKMKQELFKRQILRTTRLRIVQLNALYKFYTTVHLAAQSVFKDDDERRALFNLT
jgi:hypothetical protein